MDLINQLCSMISSGEKSIEECINSFHPKNNCYLSYSHLLTTEIRHFLNIKQTITEINSDFRSNKVENNNFLTDEDLDQLLSQISDDGGNHNKSNKKTKKKLSNNADENEECESISSSQMLKSFEYISNDNNRSLHDMGQYGVTLHVKKFKEKFMPYKKKK